MNKSVYPRYPTVGNTPHENNAAPAATAQEIKEAKFAKDDQHLHPLLGARIQDWRELPVVDDWSKYNAYAQKTFYIMNPRLPSMNRNWSKFCCRRIYRLVTIDGTISEAYISTITNENAILFAIFAAVLSTAYKKLNPDSPPPENEHHLNTISIATNIFIVIVVFSMIGLAKRAYSLSCAMRSDKQDVQRALFNDYENKLKEKMVVFSTRSWRFDSADEADAREVAQAVWSENYNVISRAYGFPATIAQFFLLESNSRRELLFKDVDSNKKN